MSKVIDVTINKSLSQPETIEETIKQVLCQLNIKQKVVQTDYLLDTYGYSVVMPEEEKPLLTINSDGSFAASSKITETIKSWLK